MAIIKKSELANLGKSELSQKLFEIRRELNSERGLAASGGRSQNPGKIRELRRTVARILTILPNKVAGDKDSKQNNEVVPPKSAPAQKGKASN